MKKLILLSWVAACGRPVVEAEPPPPVPDRVVEVRVGDTGYCTRSLKGAVRCHGSDGDFSLATEGARALAVQPVWIYADILVACALFDGGRVDCDSAGERTSLQLDGAVAISFGYEGLCGLTASGEVWCTYQREPRLRRVEAVHDAVSLVGGNGFGCALERGGAVKCWGGDVGVPAVPPETVATSIAAGAFHVCIVRDDGTSACWSTEGPMKSPFGKVTELAGGFDTTCWLDEGGASICWFGDKELDLPFPPLEQLAAGGWGVCGLDADATIFCQPLGWPP
jgi:hypothetical protein